MINKKKKNESTINSINLNKCESITIFFFIIFGFDFELHLEWCTISSWYSEKTIWMSIYLFVLFYLKSIFRFNN